MLIIPSDKCVRCFFEKGSLLTCDFPSSEIEIYYGFTVDLSSKIFVLEDYILPDEKLKADKLHYQEDRDTYILCHGVLRSIISRKLNIKPSEVIFSIDKNKKPLLKGNQLYFNITHVRGAFAVIISRYFTVGIDMENIDQHLDLIPIIHTAFSNRECKFIFRSGKTTKENSCILWTRKEAFLKAIGSGLIENLDQVEVSEKDNTIKKELFDNELFNTLTCEYFIYSETIRNYCLSIALPLRTDLKLCEIDKENIFSVNDKLVL